MAEVTPEFTTRWQSAEHIGEAKPFLFARIRTGRFNRAYGPWVGPTVDATIGASDPDNPWQATWTPTSDWVGLPSVYSCDRQKNYDGNGIETATIVVESTVWTAEEGGHHRRQRGYLAPLRGYVAAGRDPLVDEAGDEITENEWFGLLSADAQITVFEGYGDEWTRVFTGLIDKPDTKSRPDRITITARSFGKTLVEERIFGWNKDPAIVDPIVFISPDDAYKRTIVGYDADASSELDSHHGPELVVDGDRSTSWVSQAHSGAGNTEWVQIRIPEGRYNRIHLNPRYAEDFYLSINPKTLEDGSAPTKGGVDLTENVWTDAHAGALVPGAFGGITYERHITGVTGEGWHDLADDGSDFIVGKDTVIRLHFRPLIADGGNYYAGVRSLRAQRLQLVEDAGASSWIIVNDITAVVTTILRWAGFKEWNVEPASADLPKRLVFNRGTYYMDAINQIKAAIGYTFFVADPTNDDDSLGVPTFRPTSTITGGAPVVTVTDEDLLEDIDISQDIEALAYIIRVRGRESHNGQTLGGDAVRRVMFTFSPPWRGTPPDYLDSRRAGIITHEVYTNPLFRSIDDCRFAAYYIALSQAFEANKAGIEIPGYPGIDLDDQIILMDVGTGITTRFLLVDRQDHFQAGEQTSWKSTLSGVLLDVPDVQAMVAIINAAIAG